MCGCVGHAPPGRFIYPCIIIYIHEMDTDWIFAANFMFTAYVYDVHVHVVLYMYIK